MPIPTPKSGESQKEFVQRCMEDNTMKSEYNQEQRLAICYNQFIEASEVKDETNRNL
jgi:hypothetical protein